MCLIAVSDDEMCEVLRCSCCQHGLAAQCLAMRCCCKQSLAECMAWRICAHALLLWLLLQQAGERLMLASCCCFHQLRLPVHGRLHAAAGAAAKS